MSARTERSSLTPGPAVAQGGVVVVVAPVPEGDEGPGPALTSQGARLAAALDVSYATLSWTDGESPDVEALAARIARTIGATRPRVLLFADDDLGRQLAPTVAFDLATSAVLGCSDVLVRDGQAVYVKPVFGGWLQREVSFAAAHLEVATLEPAAVPIGSASHDGVRPVVLAMAAGGSGEQADHVPAVTRLELVPPDPRTVDIVHARRVVGAGMGAASDALLSAVQELADLLEGSVGATRPVVDDGGLPKERLIGQTGKSVAPDLYLALGISGSPHHVAGVQRAGRIVAVNRDEHAPILSFSDAGYIADLETLLPALLRRIKEWRDGTGEQDGRDR